MSGPALDPIDLALAKIRAQQAPPTGDAMDAALAKIRAGGTPTPPPSTHGTAYNLASTAANAALLGLGSKIGSAVEAAIPPYAPGSTFAQRYAKTLANEQGGIQQVAQQHPYGAAAASAVGSVPAIIGSGITSLAPQAGQLADAAGPFFGGSEVAGGTPMLQRAGGAARTGAGFGALNAVGNSPAGTSVGQTVLRAGAGGLAGGGLGFLSVPAADAISSIAGRLPGATPPPVQLEPGDTRLLTAFQRARTSPQSMITNLESVPLEKPVTMMEAAGPQSYPIRAVGKYVARVPSTGQTDIRTAVAERASPTPTAANPNPVTGSQRVLGDVGNALGVSRQNLTLSQQQLADAQQQAAAPFYERAFGPETPPVPLTATDPNDESGTTLAQLFQRPSVKNAVNIYNKIAAETGKPPMELPGSAPSAGPSLPPVPPGFAPEQWADVVSMLRKQGIPVPGEAAPNAATAGAGAMPLQQLQTLKFQLDGLAGYAKKTGQLLDGTPIENKQIGAIINTGRSLDNIMRAHSPDYAQGNDIWAGGENLKAANEEGQNFTTTPIGQLQATYPLLTPGEQTQYKVGAVSGPIRDVLYGGQAIDRQKALRNPNMVERLNAIASPDDIANLYRNLGVEHEIAATGQAIPNGSDTMENINNELEGLSDQARFAQGAGRVAGGLLFGSPRRAARSIYNQVLDSKIMAVLQNREGQANALAPKLLAGIQGTQQSRQQLLNQLYELSRKQVYLNSLRPSPPFMGATTGATLGSLFQGTGY